MRNGISNENTTGEKEILIIKILEKSGGFYNPVIHGADVESMKRYLETVKTRESNGIYQQNM